MSVFQIQLDQTLLFMSVEKARPISWQSMESEVFGMKRTKMNRTKSKKNSFLEPTVTFRSAVSNTVVT